MKKTAKNMNELNSILIKEMRKSMKVVSEKILGDMYDKTYGFYTKGDPKVYQRTGALGDTPKVTAPIVTANTVFFNAYLDTSHEYTTGKNPTMLDILNLANYGETNSSVGVLRPTLGNKHFWEASVDKMSEHLDVTMGKFFDRI